MDLNKPGTERWNSVSDALKTIYSFSRVTKGSGPASDDCSVSNQSAGSSRIDNSPEPGQNEVLNHNGTTSDEEIVDETPMFGGGRGLLLQNLQKQFARQKLDETIHNELKMVFGDTDFSNEAIENHFASVCSSPSTSTQETGVFSDVEDYEQGVDIVVGESSIMKKINAHEKSIAMMKKKKTPRCRNAVVLSLTQKKTSNENEQDTKKVPELKGPDLFLPNKSYSTVVSAANSSNFNQAGATIFNDEDFPAL